MTDEGALWPRPNFGFSVDLGFGSPVPFQEVNGMDGDPAPAPYRTGDTPEVARHAVPAPGSGKRVTLHRGLFPNDPRFREFYDAIRTNTAPPRTVTITLLDERGGAKVTWTLNNAWPTKIASTDMKSDGLEVAVETLELACDTIAMTPA
jgi:phage tail-like protein